ncbi:hypothetical protein SAMN05720606_104107 [Paenibacillus polysaccharolyticus]|uniref:Uncharacterized protein n=1 Tax=Paenibacillus polysaccharolyticus TaxID=582692 RepID=A0A1G5F9M9_9BACL|nr:hypothetical protein [Paenibacillus polysaccharolyticus]SCY35590.1 hypothetical protein SAMN05720606_104107 [Paenibacillus polysaccharolyticus]
MILKKRIFKIGCCLAFVILLVLTYSFYREKRMYEQYLTSNIRQDMVDMKSAIITNDRIFNRILEDGKIINQMVEDGEQARQVYYGLIDIMQIIDKYNFMNLTLSQEANWLVKPAPLFINHIEVGDIWPQALRRMQMTFERLDISNYLVSAELKARIQQYQELNQRWLNIVGDFETTVIEEKDWPQILNDLEQETRSYFKEKNVDFVEDDVWRDALNPRYD